jgi:hypothetical protein
VLRKSGSEVVQPGGESPQGWSHLFVLPIGGDSGWPYGNPIGSQFHQGGGEGAGCYFVEQSSAGYGTDIDADPSIFQVFDAFKGLFEALGAGEPIVHPSVSMK